MGDLVSIAYPASAGVNTANEPAYFDGKERGHFIQQANNLRIYHGRWRTRYRVVGQQITGTDETVAQWRADHTQSAMWYLPQDGQGVHYSGTGPDRLVESAAGRLYTLTPTNTGFEVLDVSGGMQAYPYLRMAWLTQAENYVIRTDGKSQTQIWSGKGTVFGSPGYNPNAKDRSRTPNAAGPSVYAGGRMYVTVFDRRILVSDSLHQTDQQSAADILAYTDQSYDITNVYFAPPASEKDIVALGVSISSGFDNSRAQGEVMSMCRGPGIWAMALGIPRDQWATAQMRHSRSKETAACGPKAFFVRDGDILMRTNRGIESLNLLARERQMLGNATIDLGADMFEILQSDDEESLLYCSLINPLRWSRMLCTVGPVIDGPRHYHLGWIAANWNPNSVREPQGMAWEGVGTMDKRLGRVIQFLPAVLDGRTRVVALTDREDGTSKGLVEITEEEGPDMLDDGTAVPVEWSLLTRQLTVGGPYANTGMGNIYAYLHEIKTDVTLRLYVRDDKHRDFMPLRSVTVKFDRQQCGQNSDRRILISKLPEKLKDSRWIQFYLAGSGVTSIDFAAKPAPPGGEATNPDPDCIVIQSDPLCGVDVFKQSR